MSEELKARITELERQLENERIRLSACGSAALGYFEGCNDEYKSGSLDDVLRLRERADSLERQLVESRDYAISEAAKIRAKYEHQQTVLVEALRHYANGDSLSGHIARAAIAELERQLVESRDYAISEAAKIRTEYEAQQAALVKALKYIAKNYIGTARCVAQHALGAVKPAGQEGGAKATSMLCDADARIAELERQQNVLVDRLLGASNYIDRLGGNSAVFRQSLVAVKGETP